MVADTGKARLAKSSFKEGTMTQTERNVQRCPNCGAEWRPTTPITGDYITCPVCFYRFEATAVGQKRAPFSVREFAEQISALIHRARTEGLSNDVITKVLRDELAYNAELANPSHTFHVQIVDLGPAEGMTRMLPPNEARIMVQRRSTPIIKR
jgi:DNA-directed RNA polymerase subunit RPC12/RpoP